eukprot:1160987-Pelagomonas_calceolata.AAC.13
MREGHILPHHHTTVVRHWRRVGQSRTECLSLQSTHRPKAACIKGRSPNWKARGLTCTKLHCATLHHILDSPKPGQSLAASCRAWDS